MTKGVLVIGGSVAGVGAALDLAESGIEVHLVESSPFLGGEGAEGIPSHLLRPRLLQAARHPKIRLWTGAVVTRLEGERGDFQAEVQQRPRYVDMAKCTACADCEKVCPVTVTVDGVERTAIYKNGKGALPDIYVIEKRGVAPCKAACPGGIHVQGYVALIRQGKFTEALALVREAIPFPGVCGRVCHHPCEAACRRDEYDEPIAIQYLKRFVADHEQQAASSRQQGEEELPAHRSSFAAPRVAVVGSGPAGLTAAYFLAREGYPVTVFEALPVTGGMMAVGIPEYRLPRDILQWEIETIEALGVEIRTNTPVGTKGNGPSLENLRKDCGAVFVAVGAHRSRRLAVPGEELEGVLHGVSFLREVSLNRAGEGHHPLPKVGPWVIVVGGGNVAIDSAMTARRLGGKQVTVLYRRSRAEMPANPWEIEEAEREGITFRFLAAPVRILGSNGRVTGLECVCMELGEPDESGRRRPMPIPGSEFALEADTVIAAIGQAVDASFLAEGGLATAWDGTFVVDPVTLATNLPGVFAGGDAVTGPATVIEAIAAGKRAAVSIGRYLRGEDLAAGRTADRPDTTGIDYYTPQAIEKQPRAEMPSLSLAQRDAEAFAEINLGFDEAQAVAEASRCLDCGVCSECLECVRVCQPEAIDHEAREERLILDIGAVILADESEGNREGTAGSQEIYRVDPDDVIQASAVAARAMADLASYRERLLLPSFPSCLSLPPRIGVFICRCGGHINGTVNVEAVTERVSHLPGVVHAQDLLFSCSPDQMKIIEKAIVEHDLNRVVLAACSCCSLDQICYSCTYQRVRCKANFGVWGETNREWRVVEGWPPPVVCSLPPANIEFVNIREHCAWVHADDPLLATVKAGNLIAAAVAKAMRLRAPAGGTIPLSGSALVVGGGPAGREAAAELAAQGFRVVLSTGGGDGARAANQRPPSVPPHWGGKKGRSVRVWDETMLVSVRGSAGDFDVALVQHGRERRLTTGAIVLAPEGGEELAQLRSAFASEDLIAAGKSLWSPLETGLPGVFLCAPALGYDPAVLGAAAAAKAAVLLSQDGIEVRPTVARVDAARCRACGTCQELCEFGAIQVKEDERGVLVAQVDGALCQGCGTCAAHCPSSAIAAGYSTDRQIEAMLEALLAPCCLPVTEECMGEAEPKTIVFTCNWSAYSALELAGHSKLSYPASVLPIKLMCLGRLHPGLVLKAFELGAGGVLLLGCPPNECHYGFGNIRAEELFAQTRALAHLLGFGEERLLLGWMAAGEGESFARKVKDFVEDVMKARGDSVAAK